MIDKAIAKLTQEMMEANGPGHPDDRRTPD